MITRLSKPRPDGVLKAFLKARKISVGIFLLFSLQYNSFDLFAQSVFAQTDSQAFLLSPQDLAGLKHIEIPEKIGFVTDVFIPAKPAGRVVFIVQDPHNNVKAQFNTAEIYDYLMTRHPDLFPSGYPFVGVEGNPLMELDYSFLTGFPVKEAVRNVSDFLVYEGRLDGTEYYKVNYKPETRIVGIEDETLYFENLMAFKRADWIKRQIGFNLQDLRRALEELKRRAYSYFLKQLDSTIRSFQDNPERLKEHFASLAQLAKAKNISLDSFEAYQTMNRLIQNENKIVKEKLGEELSKLGIFEASFTFESRQETRKALERLEEAIERIPLDPGHFPQTKRYLEFLEATVALRAEEFFGDLEKIYETLTKAFAQTDREKLIADRDRKLALIEKMWKLEVTDVEFAYFEGHRRELLDPELFKPLNAIFEEYLLPYRVTDQFYEVSLVLREAEHFYQSALARNDALLTNAFSQMDQAAVSSGFMVVGGFHAEGITNRLREKNIPYVLMIPQVGLEEDQSLYWKTLSGERTPLEKLLRYYTAKAVNLLGTQDPASVKAALSILIAEPNALRFIRGNPAFLEEYGSRLTEEQRKFLESAEITDRGVRVTLTSETGKAFEVLIEARLVSEDEGREAGKKPDVLVHPTQTGDMLLVTTRVSGEISELRGISPDLAKAFVNQMAKLGLNWQYVSLVAGGVRVREGKDEFDVRLLDPREASEADRKAMQEAMARGDRGGTISIPRSGTSFAFAFQAPLREAAGASSLGRTEFIEALTNPDKAFDTLHEVLGDMVQGDVEFLGSGGQGIVVGFRNNEGKRQVVKFTWPENETKQSEVLANLALANENDALWVMRGLSGIPNKVGDMGKIELGGKSRRFLIMERIDGLTLTDFLTRYPGPLTPQARLKLFSKILGVVQGIHGKRFLHRDLKPENILIRGDPARGIDQAEVFVIDFGFSHSLDVKTPPIHGHGTPGFAAPEVLVTRREVPQNMSSDIYSLGAVLYFLLTGERPISEIFEAALPETYTRLSDAWKLKREQLYPNLNPEAARMLDEILFGSRIEHTGSLVQDPRDRYFSAEAFRYAVEETLGLMERPPQLGLAVTPGRTEFTFEFADEQIPPAISEQLPHRLADQKFLGMDSDGFAVFSVFLDNGTLDGIRIILRYPQAYDKQRAGQINRAIEQKGQELDAKGERILPMGAYAAAGKKAPFIATEYRGEHPELAEEAARQLQNPDGLLENAEILSTGFAGTGGLADVYAVTFRKGGQTSSIAVKIPKIPGTVRPDSFRRFNGGASALEKAAREHAERVVRFRGSGEVEYRGPDGAAHPVPFLVMDFIEGGNLHDYVSRQGEPRGIASERKLIDRLLVGLHFVRNAALSVQDFHEKTKLVHQDVKPGNFLIDKKDNVYLTDTDFAGTAEEIESAPEDELSGTPLYMSPEQVARELPMADQLALGLSRVDERSDIYSLGSTLYQVLTGRSPVEGRDLRAVINNIREGNIPLAPSRVFIENNPSLKISDKVKDIFRRLDEAYQKARNRNPDARFGSAKEFAEVLNSLIERLTAEKRHLIDLEMQEVRRRLGEARSMGSVMDKLQTLKGLSGREAFTDAPVSERIGLIKKILSAVKVRGSFDGLLNPSDLVETETGAIEIRPGASVLTEYEALDGYSAPEKMPGSETTVQPESADLFALATIFYELLTGKAPFAIEEKNFYGWFPEYAEDVTARRPSEILGEVRPAGFEALDFLFDRVLAQALKVNPGRRFASIRDFVTAMETAMEGLARAPTVRLPVFELPSQVVTPPPAAPSAAAAPAQLPTQRPRVVLSSLIADAAFDPDFYDRIARNFIEKIRNTSHPLGDKLGADAVPVKVAEGGMGIIYKVTLNTGETLALKFPTSFWDPEIIGQFNKEAGVQKAISENPDVVGVIKTKYDSDENYLDYPGAVGDKIPFVFMEFIEGEGLDDYVRNKNSSLEKRLELLGQIAQSLHSLHQAGILHRDIKPANILVDRQGKAHLGDFGLADEIEAIRRQGQVPDILGTPLYMSPEQASGQNDQMGPASDVYSLASVAYEILTGRRHVLGDENNVMEIASNNILGNIEREIENYSPRISKALEDVLNRARSGDINVRHQSAEELAQALTDVLRGIETHQLEGRFRRMIREGRRGLENARRVYREQGLVRAVGYGIAGIVRFAIGRSMGGAPKEAAVQPAMERVAIPASALPARALQARSAGREEQPSAAEAATRRFTELEIAPLAESEEEFQPIADLIVDSGLAPVSSADMLILEDSRMPTDIQRTGVSVLIAQSQDPHFYDGIARDILANVRNTPGHPLKDQLDENAVPVFVGRGGMGVVFKVTLKNGEALALKIPRYFWAQRDLDFFKTEVEVLNTLSQNANVFGVPKIRSLPGEDYLGDLRAAEGKIPFVFMDFIEGENLGRFISRTNPSLEKRLELLEQAARVLHSMHGAGILFRDIKPSNLMVDKNGKVSLIDFGLADMIARIRQRGRSPTGLGTAMYVSPEQAHGFDGLMGPASDVYSLAALAHEILTGEDPVSGTGANELVRNVATGNINREIKNYSSRINQALEDVLNKARNEFDASQPRESEAYFGINNRFQSAEEFADALQNVLSGIKTRALENRFQRLAREARRGWQVYRQEGVRGLVRLARGRSMGVAPDARDLVMPALERVTLPVAAPQARSAGRGESISEMMKAEKERLRARSAEDMKGIIRARLLTLSQIIDLLRQKREAGFNADLTPSRIRITRDGVQIDETAPTPEELDRYGAPEQMLARKNGIENPATKMTDVFTLGGIFYELLTGKAPYTKPDKDRLISQEELPDVAPIPFSERLKERGAGLPYEVDRVFKRSLAFRPESRTFRTLDEFQAALHVAIESLEETREYETVELTPSEIREAFRVERGEARRETEDEIRADLIKGVIREIKLTTQFRLDESKPPEPVGEGTGGFVFKLYRFVGSRPESKPFAVKVSTAKESSMNALKNEAILLAMLRRRPVHKAVVKYMSAGLVIREGKERGRPFIITEFVDGKPLNQFLKEIPSLEKRLDILEQVARAIHFLHGKGIIYRDIKPENIIVDLNGKVRLIDFGLALDSVGLRNFREGAIAGTPLYMSHEQALGQKQRLGPRSDVYGLGALAYKVLTGWNPVFFRQGMTALDLAEKLERDQIQKEIEAEALFKGFPAKTRNALADRGLNTQLKEILNKARAFNVNDRFASAKEFAAAIRDFRNKLRREVTEIKRTEAAPRAASMGFVQGLKLVRDELREASLRGGGRTEAMALGASARRLFAGAVSAPLPGVSPLDVYLLLDAPSSVSVPVAVMIEQTERGDFDSPNDVLTTVDSLFRALSTLYPDLAAEVKPEAEAREILSPEELGISASDFTNAESIVAGAVAPDAYGVVLRELDDPGLIDRLSKAEGERFGSKRTAVLLVVRTNKEAKDIRKQNAELFKRKGIDVIPSPKPLVKVNATDIKNLLRRGAATVEISGVANVPLVHVTVVNPQFEGELGQAKKLKVNPRYAGPEFAAAHLLAGVYLAGRTEEDLKKDIDNNMFTRDAEGNYEIVEGVLKGLVELIKAKRLIAAMA